MQLRNNTRNGIKITLADKVHVIVLVSVACCAIFIGTFSYYQSKRMLSENIGDGLKKIAQTAALSIDTDKLDNIESSKDLFYADIKNYLLKVKDYNEIKSPIYILKKVSPNMASLLVTTEEGAPIGAQYKLTPTLKRVLNSGRGGYSPIYTDKSGSWISAYAPVTNKFGFISGVLELDHNVGYYIEEMKSRLAKLIILCIFGFLIALLLGIPLLRPILKSVSNLGIAALEMEKGNYDHEIKLYSFDEIGHLAQAFEKMRRAIKIYTERLKISWIKEKEAHLESVKALSEAIAVRESYTKGHIERVAKYAELIARELGLAEGEIEIIKYGCVIHDIGKIGINVDIITKSTKLTPSEREDINKHPLLGAKIIKGVEFLEKAEDIILYHHERYDGKGYPKGLKGDEIPLSARIVALVDTYDAMASTRPYREKFEREEIVAKIQAESGKQFDPKIVEAFLKVKDKLNEATDP